MRSFQLIFSAIVAQTLLYAPAAEAAAAAPASLVGIWYGEGQPDDPNVVYLDFFHADGTFVSEFRKYDNCKILEDHVESGTWKSVGKVQSLVTTEINGRPAHFEHSYTIELLSAQEQRARLQGLGYLFVERRVSEFIFPGCFRGA